MHRYLTVKVAILKNGSYKNNKNVFFHTQFLNKVIISYLLFQHKNYQNSFVVAWPMSFIS